MANITLKGNPIHTIGELPVVGSPAPDFELTSTDLSSVTLANYSGKRVILNVFPSVDTGTCAASVRRFNQEAGRLSNAVVLCVSRDLPFAHARFCGAEGIDHVVSLSDFRDGSFGKNYQLSFADGPLAGLLSRCIIALDEHHKVIYTQQVAETVDEPDYAAALKTLQ